MKEAIKKYFCGKLNSPSSLTKAIKLAPESILTYLNDELKANPNWEKLRIFS